LVIEMKWRPDRSEREPERRNALAQRSMFQLLFGVAHLLRILK